MQPFSTVLGTTFVMLNVINLSNTKEPDPDSTPYCYRELHAHNVKQYDSTGRVCEDTVNFIVCMGKCFSNETPHWKFPHKESYQTVCSHRERALKKVLLTNCEPGVEPGTEVFEYMEPKSCECSKCKTFEADCRPIEGENKFSQPLTRYTNNEIQ